MNVNNNSEYKQFVKCKYLLASERDAKWGLTVSTVVMRK